MALSSPCLGEDSGQGWNQLRSWQRNREAPKAEDELEPAQVWNALVEPHRENLVCAGQVHIGSSHHIQAFLCYEPQVQLIPPHPQLPVASASINTELGMHTSFKLFIKQLQLMAGQQK